MTRTSIYDRLSQPPPLATASHPQPAVSPDPPSARVSEPNAVALTDAPSTFTFGAFTFAFPVGAVVSEIDATVLVGNEPSKVYIQRQAVLKQQSQDEVFAAALASLRQRYLGLCVIREGLGSLAGNKALTLDFHFSDGEQERHGRLLGALVPLAGRQERQWLGIHCVLNPQNPALESWLLDFDHSLAGLAAC